MIQESKKKGKRDNGFEDFSKANWKNQGNSWRGPQTIEFVE